MKMQALQELGYPGERDYRAGSPHLLHWQLYDRLSTVLRDTIAAVIDAGLPPTVLEIGAGHGALTEPALAAGAQVTATDMSRPSVERLAERFRTNPAFRAVLDLDGALSALGDEQFSMVVCSSVLHHIPDYLAFLKGPMISHVARGGAFLSIQDPMWYPSVGQITHRLDRWGFLAWRVTQGSYRQGFATIRRRLLGLYDEANPSDMVEYHVVRQGVDQAAIEQLLAQSFELVELKTYWSAVAAPVQRIGEKIGRPNTFAFCALRRC